MTLGGVVAKSLVLITLVIGAAAFSWMQTMPEIMASDVVVESGQMRSLTSCPASVWGFVLIGCLGGFVVALVCILNPRSSPVFAPIYAVLEGLCLGGISAMFEYMYPGIVLQAVGLTFGIFVALLMTYATGLIKPSENFKLGIVAATGGICLLYLVTIGLGFFGIAMPFIHETGWMGIGFSVFVCIIAALNLVLDFDFIETGCERGAPKYMEWYASFGLLVTLVWLYLEILRLLAKLKSNK
jgi:uncharacterized YccA/Bax inhibitor family protein